MTKKYIINNKEYASSDLVEWDDAIAEDNFYFYRAKNFGLPLPPACFVADIGLDELSDDEQKRIAMYHMLFKDAEATAATEAMWALDYEYEDDPNHTCEADGGQVCACEHSDKQHYHCEWCGKVM